VRVLYSGLLRSPASWARVGRELLRTLAKYGVEVGALRVRGFLYDPRFPLPHGIREVRRGEFEPDVELTFAHPALYSRLRAPHRAGILVYEADRMPASWAEPIKKELDLLLLPSEFCRKGALHAGVPSHMVRLLPFGVDMRTFKPPPGDPPRPFTFLCVAAPHKRKGLEELFRAYRAAFSSNDGVRLVVKTTYNPAARRRRFRWELPDPTTVARTVGLLGPGAPSVVIRTGTLTDAELAELYRSAHVFVQPSYGEGFGLAALEAASCGCAVITTGWGGAAEVFAKAEALHVAYDLVSAEPYEYDRESGGLMAKPRVGDLARAMRAVWSQPELLRRLRTVARRVAARYHWDEMGRRLRDYLCELSRQPPRH